MKNGVGAAGMRHVAAWEPRMESTEAGSLRVRAAAAMTTPWKFGVARQPSAVGAIASYSPSSINPRLRRASRFDGDLQADETLDGGGLGDIVADHELD